MKISASRLLITAACVAAATGCTSLSGIDGSTSYACKAPDGIKCDSVSGTYYNALQNNLPSQRTTREGLGQTPASDASQSQPVAPAVALAASPGAAPAMPLRSGPRILRLWIKPWEDSDHDLNGESVVYVKIDNGHWMVDHAQRQASEAFAPVRPGRQVAPRATDPQARIPQSDAAAVADTLRALQQRPPISPTPTPTPTPTPPTDN